MELSKNNLIIPQALILCLDDVGWHTNNYIIMPNIESIKNQEEIGILEKVQAQNVYIVDDLATMLEASIALDTISRAEKNLEII